MGGETEAPEVGMTLWPLFLAVLDPLGGCNGIDMASEADEATTFSSWEMTAAEAVDEAIEADVVMPIETWGCCIEEEEEGSIAVEAEATVEAEAVEADGGGCLGWWLWWCCILLDLTLDVGEVTTEEMAELSAENLVGVWLLSNISWCLAILLAIFWWLLWCCCCWYCWCCCCWGCPWCTWWGWW